MFPLDRVAQYIESTGTSSSQTLGAAVPSFLSASDAADASGVSSPWRSGYLIVTAAGGWELGIGDFDSSSIDRVRVLRSSNTNDPLDLPDDGPTSTIVYAVPTALSAIAASMDDEQEDSFSGIDPALGPRIAVGQYGSVAAGPRARVDAYAGSAFGARSRVRVRSGAAIGIDATARVTGALTVGAGTAGAVEWVGSRQTTSATPAAALNREGHPFIPWTTGAYLVEAQIVGRRTAPSAAVYAATITALVYRVGAANFPILVGTPVKTVIAQSAGVTCDCDIVIDEEPYEIADGVEVEGAVGIEVTGAASQTWNWTVVIRAAEQAG